MKVAQTPINSENAPTTKIHGRSASQPVRLFEEGVGDGGALADASAPQQQFPHPSHPDRRGRPPGKSLLSRWSIGVKAGAPSDEARETGSGGLDVTVGFMA